MSDSNDEFLPLPYFPWEVRPSHIGIDVEEAATALYLAEGVVSVAAERLRVDSLRLQRAINRSPRLVRLHGELIALLNDKVHAEVIRAFKDDDSRRREWASSKVMSSRQFQSHPLAPNTQVIPSLSITQENNNITFVWRTEPLRVDSSPTDADGQSGKLIEAADEGRGSSD